MFKLRKVAPLYSPTLVKLWLEHCTHYHGPGCYKGITAVHGMRLIDCVEMEVVKSNPFWRWVALSYVWGTAQTNESTWSKTVMDTIKVTKEKCYRYLWVDKHCISQDDGAHKEEQIRNMHKIYQGADLTIVAASGNSMHADIEGVSIERRGQSSVGHNEYVHPQNSPGFSPLVSLHKHSP